MRPRQQPASGLRTAVRPGLEALEPRALLTAPVLFTATRAAPLGIVRAALPAAVAGPRPDAEPTPHERARQRFEARFAGSFATGPGRYTDQAAQTYSQGGGTSNTFLHGDLQMVVFSPLDPAQPTTGLAALIDKNVADSGNLLLLDLVGDPSSVDRGGRPTRLTWTVNDGSGGSFQGASGEGTVEIRYRPGGKLPPRARSAGSVGVIFRGQLATLGVVNVLRGW